MVYGKTPNRSEENPLSPSSHRSKIKELEDRAEKLRAFSKHHERRARGYQSAIEQSHKKRYPFPIEASKNHKEYQRLYRQGQKIIRKYRSAITQNEKRRWELKSQKNYEEIMQVVSRNSAIRLVIQRAERKERAWSDLVDELYAEADSELNEAVRCEANAKEMRLSMHQEFKMQGFGFRARSNGCPR